MSQLHEFENRGERKLTGATDGGDTFFKCNKCGDSIFVVKVLYPRINDDQSWQVKCYCGGMSDKKTIRGGGQNGGTTGKAAMLTCDNQPDGTDLVTVVKNVRNK